MLPGRIALGIVPESQEHKKALKTIALELDRPRDSAKLTARRFGITILFFRTSVFSSIKWTGLDPEGLNKMIRMVKC